VAYYTTKGANKTSLQRSKVMLHTAYSAILKLQEKKSSLTSISALKELLYELNLNLEIEISSSRVWVCKLDLLKNIFYGVIDLEIRPMLIVQDGVRFDATQCHRHPKNFNFHFEGTSISKASLEGNFLNILLDAVADFQVRC